MKLENIAKLFHLTKVDSEERRILTQIFDEAGKFDMLAKAVLGFTRRNVVLSEEPDGIARRPHGGADVF